MACANETNMANRILRTTGGTALRTGRVTTDLKGPKSRSARTRVCKRRGVRWKSFGGEIAKDWKQPDRTFGSVLNCRVFPDDNLRETLVSVLATGSSPSEVRQGGDCTEFSFWHGLLFGHFPGRFRPNSLTTWAYERLANEHNSLVGNRTGKVYQKKKKRPPPDTVLKVLQTVDETTRVEDAEQRRDGMWRARLVLNGASR